MTYGDGVKGSKLVDIDQSLWKISSNILLIDMINGKI